MQAFKISKTLSLGIEAIGKNVRLIVIDGYAELACRKESFSAIRQFLLSDKTQLFKGRLQLHKNQDMLTIFLKGEPVGEVDHAVFEKIISTTV